MSENPSFSFESLTENIHDLISNAANLSYRRFFHPQDHYSGREYGLPAYLHHHTHYMEAKDAISHFAIYEEDPQSLISHTLALAPKQVIQHGFAYGAHLAEARSGISHADKAERLKDAQKHGQMLQSFMAQASDMAANWMQDHEYGNTVYDHLNKIAEYIIPQGYHYAQWRNSSPV